MYRQFRCLCCILEVGSRQRSRLEKLPKVPLNFRDSRGARSLSILLSVKMVLQHTKIHVTEFLSSRGYLSLKD